MKIEKSILIDNNEKGDEEEEEVRGWKTIYASINHDVTFKCCFFHLMKPTS